jgi:hypothetical protein
MASPFSPGDCHDHFPTFHGSKPSKSLSRGLTDETDPEVATGASHDVNSCNMPELKGNLQRSASMRWNVGGGSKAALVVLSLVVFLCLSTVDAILGQDHAKGKQEVVEGMRGR